MRMKLTLWILMLLPIALAAQEMDSPPVKLPPTHNKRNKPPVLPDNGRKIPLPEEEKPDFSRESIFKALFVGGVNIAQIDGDDEYGYRKVGAHVGVGTVVKFSKLFSVSMELLYSMKGARPRYSSYDNGTPNKYDISLDYIELPISFNIHDKKVVMFGAGLQVGALMRYSQTDSAGRDITANPVPKGEQPRKIDLSAQVCVTFFIRQRIGLGLRFSYSMLPLRDALPSSSLKGEYNNTLSVRLSYLLDPKNPHWPRKK